MTVTGGSVCVVGADAGGSAGLGAAVCERAARGRDQRLAAHKAAVRGFKEKVFMRMIPWVSRRALRLPGLPFGDVNECRHARGVFDEGQVDS